MVVLPITEMITEGVTFSLTRTSTVLNLNNPHTHRYRFLICVEMHCSQMNKHPDSNETRLRPNVLPISYPAILIGPRELQGRTLPGSPLAKTHPDTCTLSMLVGEGSEGGVERWRE